VIIGNSASLENIYRVYFPNKFRFLPSEIRSLISGRHLGKEMPADSRLALAGRVKEQEGGVARVCRMQ